MVSEGQNGDQTSVGPRSITVKRNVLLRSIVTPKLREEIMAELQEAAEEVDRRIQQLEFQAKAYLSELQRTNLQQAMAVRKQIEAEKKRQEEERDALLERRAKVGELEDGTEIVRGALESLVELTVGDNLRQVLSGIEVVTKDDVVVEIRQRDWSEGLEENVVGPIEQIKAQRE